MGSEQDKDPVEEFLSKKGPGRLGEEDTRALYKLLLQQGKAQGVGGIAEKIAKKAEARKQQEES